MKTLGDEIVVAANGYPSREACAIADRPQNFYMIGSMGLAAAIRLGLALGRPRRRVVVFDGDGNLMMSLGVLGNVAALGPVNFIHCVFDNEAYGSTGNQRSLAATVRLDRLAAAAGYRSVAAVTTAEEVGAALRAMLGRDGPHFLLVKVTREQADVPRIPHAPEALRDRFRAAVLAP
jgi:thiamine pyrophosphate-dependent acetolactate synthase large subunit-like protein